MENSNDIDTMLFRFAKRLEKHKLMKGYLE